MMKKKITVFLILFLGIKILSYSQQLFTENFDYTSSSQLANSGWLQVTTNTILPVSTTNLGLTYNGYALSGIGNAAKIDTTGQDIYRDLYNNTTTGNLYTSFMLNVNKATTSGDYFFALFPQGALSGSFARLYVKLASVGYYKIGLTKGTETNIVYGTDSFPLNVTSLLVVKYQYNVGLTNDSVMAYNFSTGFPINEPNTPTVSTIGGTTTDATTLARITLRQGTNTSAPRLTIDGIRSANIWGELNAATSSIQPSVFAVTSSAITTSSATISWTKNNNQIDSTMTTLVFVKPILPVQIGVPTFGISHYTANSNFSLSNSFYENDGVAKCVFKGTTNTVAISGLNQNTLYQVAVMVVRNVDSAYATAITNSFTTISTAPKAITALTASTVAQTTATINWIKPTGYATASNTMAIYVKALSSINTGTPNTNPTVIYSDTNFNGTGSLFMLDSNAKCVYKGDSIKVNLTNLTAGINYYMAAYAINDIDSNYSTVAVGSFRTNSLGPINVKSVSVVSLATTNCKITWTRDSSYNANNFTTLVYLKQGSAIVQGTPTKNPINMFATDSFGLGSVYENDNAAYCVYKGDSNFVMPINLTPNTLYYALIYVVNNIDTLYSNPSMASGTTRALPPSAVLNASVAGLTVTTAKISWVKPSNYINANYSTLVFVKAGSTINEGVPTKTVTAYTANSSFVSTLSTRYENDTAAKCAYKGDTNFVTITAINNYTNYQVLIYVIRDIDSTYSNKDTTSGKAAPNPPAPNFYTISQINKVNTTTGVPDSINIRVALRGKVYSINQKTATQGGTQFLLRDNTGGITIASTSSTYGYTPLEGDSLLVYGIVSSTRGLLVLTTLDSLSVIANNRTLEKPTLVSKLSETTENDLIELDSVRFLTTPTGTTWTANGTYSILTTTNDTVAIRIYASSALAGVSYPTTSMFNVIGLGSQVSSQVSPFAFKGYQILPKTTLTNALSMFKFVAPLNNANVKIEGDSNKTINFEWTNSTNDPIINKANYTLMVDTLQGNFVNPIAVFQSGNGGVDTALLLRNYELRNILINLGITPNETKALKFRVVASSDKFTSKSDSIIINFTMGYMLGINNKQPNILSVYPNPCSSSISVKMPLNIGSNAIVEIVDITGKVFLKENINTVSLNEIMINTHLLNKGFYLLKLSTSNETYYQKIIKE